MLSACTSQTALGTLPNRNLATVSPRAQHCKYAFLEEEKRPFQSRRAAAGRRTRVFKIQTAEESKCLRNLSLIKCSSTRSLESSFSPSLLYQLSLECLPHK